MTQALRDIATISLWAADHNAAVKWYSELLGTKAYFARPGYAEFRLGDYQTEVGIIDSKYAPHLTFPQGPAGVVVYWHVDGVQKTPKARAIDGRQTTRSTTGPRPWLRYCNRG